jgi:predicted RNA-binding protein with PUA domain
MAIHKKQFLLNGDILTVSFDEETKDFEASISVKGVKPIIEEVKKTVKQEKPIEEEEEKPKEESLLI